MASRDNVSGSFAAPFCETPDASRRALLAGGGALFAWAWMPKFARAAGGRDPRLVTIILRGAMDGLSAVAPVGDPDYVALRAGIALATSGDNPALPLDGFFALHPAMPNFARLYRANQAMVVHAVASPIASGRISTARTCWSPACPAWGGSRAAG